MTGIRWLDLPYKELQSFNQKTGRNTVGAFKWQMDFIEAATKSRDKTAKKYKPDISHFFIQQSDRIIDRFNEFFGIKEANDLFPLDQLDNVVHFILPSAEDVLFTSATRPLHTSAIQKSVDDANELTLTTATVSSSLSNSAIVEKLAQIGRRVTRVNATTREIIRDRILTGVSNGENVVTIRESIRQMGLDEYYQGRAMTIARTETRYAYDAGGKIAYEALGDGGDFDVVGCVGTLAGANELGLEAGYGSYTEDYGSCGVLNVPMTLWDAVSELHHVNHQGVMVPTERL